MRNLLLHLLSIITIIILYIKKSLYSDCYLFFDVSMFYIVPVLFDIGGQYSLYNEMKKIGSVSKINI